MSGAEFRPRLDIMPAGQRRLWPDLSQVPRGFVLYGGTGLALRLGHRQSVDFDFFGSEAFDAADLRASIPLLAASEVEQLGDNVLTAWLRPDAGERAVKLSFFGSIDIPVLEKPDVSPDNGILVASMADLAGTKAKVINQRIELRDYQDIAAILDSGWTLEKIVCAAVTLFRGQVDFITTVSAISYFGEEVSRSFPEALKKQLRKAARGAAPTAPPEPQYPSIGAAAKAAGR